MKDDDTAPLPTPEQVRAQVSRGTLKLIDAVAAIRETPDVVKADALGFSTRVLVQAGLPHSNPAGNPPAWVRTNGNFSLVVQPRVLPSGKVTGYPYGGIPRLIVADGGPPPPPFRPCLPRGGAGRVAALSATERLRRPMNPNKQKPFRHPGVQEVSEDRVLLVTRHKASGQERIDWWPSVAEAEASDHHVVEVRERIHVPKEKKDWTGSASFWRFILGKSGTQDRYTREHQADQKEFFHSVIEKKGPEQK